MAILVALHHKTSYLYDRLVQFGPQIVRLRPAPHCRTPILSYSLKVEPKEHFLNWQQDAYSNYLARLVFEKPAQKLEITVDLVAEMVVINPFDFFLEEYAEKYPFKYEPAIGKELIPYLETLPLEPHLAAFVEKVKKEIVRPGRRTIDVLVETNQLVQQTLKYDIRMEPGVQTPEETLTKAHGSCRDFTWLMVQTIRHLGLAARFVSGYSIQLVADVKALDGPSGVTQDITDLHAWTEVFLPGAGWIGLDSTSGLMCGEGHIPLACTADPGNAAPIAGGFAWLSEEKGKDDFKVEMSVTRIHEDPRVTKPYTDTEWMKIEALGHQVDNQLRKDNVKLTMGGEPTFVSIDDMDGPEWNTAAQGPTKRILSGQLIKRLQHQFAPGALLHFGQGKWYPGESLPRYAFGCYWRKDGVPIWQDQNLFGDEKISYSHGDKEAKEFAHRLTKRLEVTDKYIQPGYEDVWYWLWKERRLPVNVDPFDSKLKEKEDRERMAKIFEQGLEKIVGYCLPIQKGAGRWVTGPWFFRPERMYLIPGDSPMGYRMPLDSLPWSAAGDQPFIIEPDPMAERDALTDPRSTTYSDPRQRYLQGATPEQVAEFGPPIDPRQMHIPGSAPARTGRGVAHQRLAELETEDPLGSTVLKLGQSAGQITRTALCVEPRNGRLHIFLPPARFTQDYLDLVAAVEDTAKELGTPVIIEGYTPPFDPRINVIKVTPDPGVIEVNIHPAHSWDELVKNTTILYEEARQTRLGTEKFMLDGRHTGTGGGNHVVIGGPTPAESPLLRRPDLLRSLVAYWHNHPSLSYLFSGTFIGPTSQAPRADEGRPDMTYELEIAFKQIPDGSVSAVSPWMVDRTMRNLLVDLTGNTHRAEFCIDKLYSPDSSSGRLGLLEFRGFEMPPHSRMSLTQQLLLRSLIARFWKQPYQAKLVRWGTELHDRFMLPHWVWQDFDDVIYETAKAGYPIKTDWFAPHLEFRFPVYGTVAYRGVEMELRQAIEPWYVMGEEPGGGGTVRYVDSSVERVQMKVQGMTDTRHIVTCNGRRVPLHPTGTNGEYIAGVRYRAWQPPNCLHPTIPVHSPLIFDLYDSWNGRSIGGCTYHVVHPGGRSYEAFPVNANEAESRRTNRFYKFGHTPGPMNIADEAVNPEFPLTLDMRR